MRNGRLIMNSEDKDTGVVAVNFLYRNLSVDTEDLCWNY
jgi:hypothetical protein